MDTQITTQIPPLCAVRRSLPTAEPIDVEATLESEFARFAGAVQGKRVAIGVGSRGISQINIMARKLVALVKAAGGEPFIVPAMGSHGGATAPGQVEMLAGLGVTEDFVGCPVHATMDTVHMGHTADNKLNTYLDRNVAEADGLILINRVKIHTDFHGPHESGLLKMLAVGLGKETGASNIHSHGTHGLREHMPEIAKHLLGHCNWIAGFGIVEDGYHRAVQIEGFAADEVVAGEQRLLDRARALMPRLPLDDIDVLVIDYMGKDISGAGMDSNIIGRWMIEGEPEPETPNISAIVVLDLTPASHGNAVGIGFADFTTRRLLDKIDFYQLTKNSYTSGFLRRGLIPLVFETDEAAIEAAIDHVYRANLDERHHARVMRIRSTLDLEQVWVSPNLLNEIRASAGFIEADDAQPLDFHDGHLW